MYGCDSQPSRMGFYKSRRRLSNSPRCGVACYIGYLRSHIGDRHLAFVATAPAKLSSF